MPEIKIKVRDKCAEGEGVVICNNSDYTVVWDLDGEWTPYDTKTMRVNLADGSYQDVVFSGDSAPLPVLVPGVRTNKSAAQCINSSGGGAGDTLAAEATTCVADQITASSFRLRTNGSSRCWANGSQIRWIALAM